VGFVMIVIIDVCVVIYCIIIVDIVARGIDYYGYKDSVTNGNGSFGVARSKALEKIYF